MRDGLTGERGTAEPFGGIGFAHGDAVAVEIFQADNEFGLRIAAVGERGQLVERRDRSGLRRRRAGATGRWGGAFATGAAPSVAGTTTVFTTGAVLARWEGAGTFEAGAVFCGWKSGAADRGEAVPMRWLKKAPAAIARIRTSAMIATTK